ncbi:MAG: DUF4387 family protein [Hyphomicrobiales bacterium]
MRATMNFKQFEALYWIARLGSFHAAARHLKTSQPTRPTTSSPWRACIPISSCCGITFDIIFGDRATYEQVRCSRALTRDSVAALYRIPKSRIADFVEFDPGCAIKFTVYRTTPSGSPGDPDIFGCQQYAPLIDVAIPMEEPAA